MHKRGLCRRAVSIRLSVTFVYSVEMSKHNLKLFHRLVYRLTILIFPHRTLWEYSDEHPLIGASNASGIWWKIATFD